MRFCAYCGERGGEGYLFSTDRHKLDLKRVKNYNINRMKCKEVHICLRVFAE